MSDSLTESKADQLAAIAIELITRVRDQDPNAVHRWLNATVEDGDWMGLCVVLACAVPDDKPWSQLTAWTWLREYGLGGPDTAEAQVQRRADLAEALRGGLGRRLRAGAP
jgi:hypothetical protein